MFDKRAIFLDRDGTLIKAIYRPDLPKKITAPFIRDELEFMPHYKEVLGFLKTSGFMRIMITNQPDVALGYMTEVNWNVIHSEVLSTLKLDDYYLCRHTEADNCPFKKPSPLMLQAAADKWGINLSRSYMVGDTVKDMEAGKAAGCETVLIRTPYNKDDNMANKLATYKIDRLAGLTNIIKHFDTA